MTQQTNLSVVVVFIFLCFLLFFTFFKLSIFFLNYLEPLFLPRWLLCLSTLIYVWFHRFLQQTETVFPHLTNKYRHAIRAKNLKIWIDFYYGSFFTYFKRKTGDFPHNGNDLNPENVLYCDRIHGVPLFKEVEKEWFGETKAYMSGSPSYLDGKLWDMQIICSFFEATIGT